MRDTENKISTFNATYMYNVRHGKYIFFVKSVVFRKSKMLRTQVPD